MEHREVLRQILRCVQSNDKKLSAVLDKLAAIAQKIDEMDRAFLSMPKAITTMRDGLAALGRDQRSRTTEIVELLRSVMRSK